MFEATADDVAATLAQLVENAADEHQPIIDWQTEEDTDAEFADTSKVVAGVGSNSSFFRVLLEDGRAFTVRVEEELGW